MFAVPAADASLTRKRSLVQIQYGPRDFSKSRLVGHRETCIKHSISKGRHPALVNYFVDNLGHSRVKCVEGTYPHRANWRGRQCPAGSQPGRLSTKPRSTSWRNCAANTAPHGTGHPGMPVPWRWPARSGTGHAGQRHRHANRRSRLQLAGSRPAHPAHLAVPQTSGCTTSSRKVARRHLLGRWPGARPRRRCSDRGPVVPDTSAIRSGLTAGLAISGPLDPVHGLRSSSEGLELRSVASPSAGLIVVVPVVVVVRMVFRGGAALTGRVGRHSTAGLAVVAAASLVVAQLDEGVGRSHPQLGSKGGVVGGPVGKEGPGAWSRPRLLTGL
jgi:hypothetical protein